MNGKDPSKRVQLQSVKLCNIHVEGSSVSPGAGSRDDWSNVCCHKRQKEKMLSAQGLAFTAACLTAMIHTLLTPLAHICNPLLPYLPWVS